MDIKNAPENASTFSEGSSLGGEQKAFTTRLAKYARLKGLNCQIGAILAPVCDESIPKRLHSCGRYLAFNQYLFSGQVKLASGNFCNLHMLCPCCAAARSRRLLARWLPLVFNPRYENRVTHYLLTLTWPPPSETACPSDGAASGDLKANLAVGQRAWVKLWKRKTNRRSGPLADVSGAILATEVTRGPSGKWHPHFHVLVTMPRNRRISAALLREEWKKLTGGVFVNLKVLRQETDVIEVFKYAVKPADLGKDGEIDSPGVITRYEIWSALKGARLIRGFGCYYGGQEEDLTQPETLEQSGAYIELIFKWMGGNYSLVRETEAFQIDKETGVINRV